MKKVIVVPNNLKVTESSCVEICNYILSLGYLVSVAEYNETIASSQNCDADMIVVLGGDGSIIDVARFTLGMNIPIIGINFGTLGYLTQIDSINFKAIGEVLKNPVIVQNRIMIDVSVIRNGNVLSSCTALNDACISNGPVVNLISYELYSDDILLEVVKSNSVVVATPTGSSAYSLSAGGPLLDPEIDAICITPVCPQKLNIRPCVINADKTISIKNIDSRSNTSLVVDGKLICELTCNDIVEIKKSKYKLPLVYTDNKSFLEVLYSKRTVDINKHI